MPGIPKERVSNEPNVWFEPMASSPPPIWFLLFPKLRFCRDRLVISGMRLVSWLPPCSLSAKVVSKDSK